MAGRKVVMIKITNALMEAIAMYMDTDARERVHYELAPCTNEEFLIRYCELEPDFADLLQGEFSVKMEDLCYEEN